MSTFQDIVAFENEAHIAYQARQYDKAAKAHGRALALAKELERPSLLAVLFNRLGQTWEADGDIQQALHAYESGLKALNEDPAFDIGDALAVLADVGKGYGAGAAPQPAPDLYSAAVATDLETATEDPSLPLKLLLNIGNMYLLQPQEKPALNAYTEALEHPAMAQAPLLRAHALTHAGIVHHRLGDSAAVETALQEALDLLEAHAEPVEKRRVLAVLAGLHRDRGEIAQALETYRQALALYAQLQDPRGEGRTWAALGHLHLEQGHFDEAREAYQQAVNLSTEVGDKETQWHAYWGLGCCDRESGDLDAAAEAFRHSLRLVALRQRVLRTDEGKVAFLESTREIPEHLLAVHLERARTDFAAYADALSVAEEARGRALYDLVAARRRHYRARQAGFRESRMRPFEARHHRMEQLAPNVPSPFASPNSVAQDAPGITSGPSVAADLESWPFWEPESSQEGAEESTDRLASLLHEGRLGSLVDEGPLDSLLDESRLESLRRESRLESLRHEGRLDSLSHEGRLEDQLDAGEPESPPQALPPLARLVFHVLAECTAIFAVTPEGAVHGHVLDWGREAVAGRVARLRSALRVDEHPRGMQLTRHASPVAAQPDIASDPLPQLRELYAALIAPVAEFLPIDGTPLVLEPHGALWLLPFAALLAPDGTWLAERWPLLYTPSAQVLDEIRQEPDYGGPQDLSALIVGNPSMPKAASRGDVEISLAPLPGAEEEANNIAGLFPDPRRTLLLGASADWASVVSRIPQHGILHLATHGIADAEDPLASFVALGPSEGKLTELLKRWLREKGGVPFTFSEHAQSSSDGLLTARQALALPIPADLVVLSACQTGLGQISGDGMIGLSRAFLVAGARAVVVSQWSVSDEATAALMRSFYQAYIAVDDKALALQQALRELRAQPEYADPRYWAPFVVIGAEA